MNAQKQADLKMGLQMEDVLKPVFESKFGELNKTHQYHSFDYENENVFIELKTRNAKWKQYPSLMFSTKKIDYIKNNNITKDVYFFWKLTDGLYYWKYDEDEYEIHRGGRNDRGRNEYTNVVYIQNEYIKNYNELPFQNYQYDESAKHNDEQ